MSSNRLEQQIQFITEVDKLKSVLRQTVLTDRSRQENSAEHSWHLAVMAILLQEYAQEKIDLLRVIRMVVVHDLVEIDAGDTFSYDEKGNMDKADRERKAADRIFGHLPEDQAAAFRDLWDEFEECVTPEARFALALDRLHPMIQNFYTQGAAWKKHGVTSRQILKRNRVIEDGSPALWAHAEQLIRDALDRGYIDS